MDLHKLRYFVAVAEAEHFHRAANRLHVAQPALSRQIKLLEEELGLSLFERLGRGVRLTEAGSVFLADAKRILQQLERAREHAREVAAGQAGTLRVCFIEIASWRGVLPDAIRAFRQTYPDVKLRLRSLNSVAQTMGLQEGRFDAAFIYHGQSGTSRIVSQPVHSDPYVLVMPAGHRLAQASNLRLRDLQDEAFLWTERTLNPELDNVLMSACLERGLVPRIVEEVSSSANIVSLVAMGIGLGLLPASIRWRLQEGVVLKTVVDLDLKFRIDIAWLEENTSQTLRHFVDLVLALACSAQRDCAR